MVQMAVGDEMAVLQLFCRKIVGDWWRINSRCFITAVFAATGLPNSSSSVAVVR